MNWLITGAWREAERHIPEIEAMGHAVRFMPQESDPLPCDPAFVEGVVCNGLFLHHPLSEFPNLRRIQLTSAGLDRVDMDEVKARGIEIQSARGVYSIPMAEFAISGVLDLYKEQAFFYDNQQQRRWDKHRGLRELYGKTVAVIGCGSVGTECAKRFRAFGCAVLGVDLIPREDPAYDRMTGLDTLNAALAQADVVVLTLPLTEQTHGLIGADRLRLMRDGAVLVNIARGAVVDTGALIEALPRLGGAVLDVFEEEPLPADSPLWAAARVRLTPHNSFVGDGNADRLWQIILQTLGR